MTIKNEDDPEFTVFVNEWVLSDKSLEFYVGFGCLAFLAKDRNAAIALAESLADAINEYTTTTADVYYNA